MSAATLTSAETAVAFPIATTAFSNSSLRRPVTNT